MEICRFCLSSKISCDAQSKSKMKICPTVTQIPKYERPQSRLSSYSLPVECQSSNYATTFFFADISYSIWNVHIISVQLHNEKLLFLSMELAKIRHNVNFIQYLINKPKGALRK